MLVRLSFWVMEYTTVELIRYILLKTVGFLLTQLPWGDSTNYFDQEVLNLTHRKTVQLNNTFNLQVDLKFNKCVKPVCHS